MKRILFIITCLLLLTLTGCDLPHPFTNLPSGSYGTITVKIGGQAVIDKTTSTFATQNEGAILFTYNGILDSNYVFTGWFHTVEYIPFTQSIFTQETANGNFNIDDITLNANNSITFQWIKMVDAKK